MSIKSTRYAHEYCYVNITTGNKQLPCLLSVSNIQNVSSWTLHKSVTKLNIANLQCLPYAFITDMVVARPSAFQWN
jgi:hypothetical protein